MEWSGDCIITNCDRFDHRLCDSAVYNGLNECILKCGKAYFGCHTPTRKHVPGWNDLVREEYRKYREQFLDGNRMVVPGMVLSGLELVPLGFKRLLILQSVHKI